MKPTKHSRRQFLKTTGAAVAVAPNVFPSSVLGRDGHVAPNDRIGMGFIGLGTQGGGHLLGGGWTYVEGGYLARKDVQVLGVCDVKRERRLPAQRRCNAYYGRQLKQSDYQGVAAYTDFRQLLERDDIDAVLMAVPYHWAAPMAIMSMRAGKDVYCEKPIAITVKEGRQLIETSQRFNRIYQAGTQQRTEYGGKFHQACEWIRNGRLGQLKEVYAYRPPGAFYPSRLTADRTVPVPEGLDWDLWLGPLPWQNYAGRTGHALPGHYIGDVNWSPHHYDFIQWVIDPDRSKPIEVEYESNSGIVHYHYSHGVTVHSIPYPDEPIGSSGGACFVGTKGRLAVDRDHLVSYPDKILQQPLTAGDQRVFRPKSHSGNFLECVRSRRPTICHPETAVFSMNSILIGGISMALKRSLTWDPTRTEFVGDSQANRLLGYAKRAPWMI